MEPAPPDLQAPLDPADRPHAAGLPSDPAALGDLLTRHHRRVYNVIYRMVSSRDDADELTQDVMLKVVRHASSFRGEAQPTTWITRIAMNTAISHLRKRRGRDTVSLEASHAADHDQAATLRSALTDHREPNALSRVQSLEQATHLQHAIDQLEEDHRAVLVLRDIDQMDYAQIAQTLELKVGTVKSRLFRARLALRKILEASQPPANDVSP